MIYAIKEVNGKRFVVSEPDRIRHGFLLWIKGKETFIITEKKNRTHQLASEILRKFALPDNPDIRSEVIYYLIPATMEMTTLNNGRKAWLFNSKDGKSGGCDPEFKTRIVEL